MHRSRLGGFIIDCQTRDLDAAARFWGEALGLKVRPSADPEDKNYAVSTRPQRARYRGPAGGQKSEYSPHFEDHLAILRSNLLLAAGRVILSHIRSPLLIGVAGLILSWPAFL